MSNHGLLQLRSRRPGLSEPQQQPRQHDFRWGKLETILLGGLLKQTLRTLPVVVSRSRNGIHYVLVAASFSAGDSAAQEKLRNRLLDRLLSRRTGRRTARGRPACW